MGGCKKLYKLHGGQARTTKGPATTSKRYQMSIGPNHLLPIYLILRSQKSDCSLGIISSSSITEFFHQARR